MQSIKNTKLCGEKNANESGVLRKKPALAQAGVSSRPTCPGPAFDCASPASANGRKPFSAAAGVPSRPAVAHAGSANELVTICGEKWQCHEQKTKKQLCTALRKCIQLAEKTARKNLKKPKMATITPLFRSIISQEIEKNNSVAKRCHLFSANLQLLRFVHKHPRYTGYCQRINKISSYSKYKKCAEENSAQKNFYIFYFFFWDRETSRTRSAVYRLDWRKLSIIL